MQNSDNYNAGQIIASHLPALLIRISNLSSSSLIFFANFLTEASDDKSSFRTMILSLDVDSRTSSAAACALSMFRQARITFAPKS